MARTLAAVFAALLILGCADAHAQGIFPPSLAVDTRFAPPDGIAREDLVGAATDIPSAVAVDDDRIYTVGEARNAANDSNLGIVARRSDGLYDTGFSDDGKLVLPIAAGIGRDVATDIVVLPDGHLRILASTDVGAGQIDVAIVGLTADGGTDTSFGPGGSGHVILPAATDTPTRMALGPTGRLAVTGAAKDAGGKEDMFVALREPDGSPVAGFGSGGVQVVNLAGTGLNDRGVDVEFRPGGGLLVLAQVETNPDAAVNDYAAVLRAFTEETGADDARFAGGGLTLAVGQPDTTPGGLMVHGGRVWVSGATKVGTDTDAFIARMNADGSGVESRRYDMRGSVIAEDQLVISSGSDLDVVPGVSPTLVVTGSINYGSRPYWAAAAFSGIDGPLADTGFGDLLIPTDEYGAIVGVAASPAGWAAIAGSLVDTSANFDTSFGTTRLLVDAEKACDLGLEVVAPLELSMPTSGVAPLSLRITNSGDKTCTGVLSLPAPYGLEGGATAFDVGPGASVTTAGLQIRYSGPRRRDDQIAIRVTGAGDKNAQNDVRTLRVLFPYCDAALEQAGAAARAPTEGARRYELSVRNRGTVACTRARVAVAAGGTLAGAGGRFTVRPGRSVSVDVRAVVAPGGKPGERARLTFRALVSDDVVRENDSVTLSPALVGVGESDVRAAGARGFRGSARRGTGGAGKALLAVRGVEIAVQRAGKGCKSLAGKSGRLRKAGSGKRCGRIWLRARGTRSWRLALDRRLPRGRYVVYSRAVIGSGFREGRFSARDRNKLAFKVS